MQEIDIFLISPVRNIAEKDYRRLAEYVAKKEAEGLKVHWPIRDTNQNASEFIICRENGRAMKRAKSIALYWNAASQGSVFDMGMWLQLWFQCKKPIAVINPEDVERTPRKSFANLVWEVHEQNLWCEARAMRRKSQDANACGRGAVGAIVVKDGHIIGRGHNTCAAMREGGCKRIGMSAGVSQELCGTLHAEVAALLNIRPKRTAGDYGRCMMPTFPTPTLVIVSFMESERELLRGAQLMYSGHYYSCAVCTAWCNLLGVVVKGDSLYIKEQYVASVGDGKNEQKEKATQS